jgi:hypothetical protein
MLPRRELTSEAMEEDAEPSVALERASEADDRMAEASLEAELAMEETAESAPEATDEATELAPLTAEETAEPASEVMLPMMEVTPPGSPEVISPPMEERTESTWALAAPAAATATKTVEKRILMLCGGVEGVEGEVDGWMS